MFFFFSRTAPKPVLEASVWMMKGCWKPGVTNTGFPPRASLKEEKAISADQTTWWGRWFLVRSCRGAARVAKFGINCQQYPTRPRNVFTCFLVTGFGHWEIVSVFHFWGLTLPLPLVKGYSASSNSSLYFFDLAVNPACRRAFRKVFSLFRWEDQLALWTTMSSR